MQITIIGAGPAGYTAAFEAAKKGLKITLIDSSSDLDGSPLPGGVCLNRGCIPSKTLLHIAKVLSECEALKEHGISFNPPSIDLGSLRTWKNEVVTRLRTGLKSLIKKYSIEFIHGHARFVSEDQIEILRSGFSAETRIFSKAIIASGSLPSKIDSLPNSNTNILDSTSALELNSIPKRMLIIGGGYIGLELGTIYSALGSRITLVEMLDQILFGVDRDLVRYVSSSLKKKFDKIILGTRITSVHEVGNFFKVEITDAKGLSETLEFDAILTAVGRVPATKELGLEKACVETDAKGFIKVDSDYRTNIKNIFAIGDAIGQPMLMHKAAAEARTAVANILGKNPNKKSVIPYVVFTDPEIAWCGITEEKVKKENISAKICRFSWLASGRAMSMGRTDGLTKIIADTATEKILGAGITGVGAGELISEIVVAMNCGATISDIASSIHPHPTLSETIMEAAELF